MKRQSAKADSEIHDPWIQKFLAHLAAERGASVYTQRNYRQALTEFFRWHQQEQQRPPEWDKLQRDDYRSYLRWLGRGKLSRAAIQLRFCALRISELCGLKANDINWTEQIVRVRGKGTKDRLVTVGAPVLAAIRNYWNKRKPFPGIDTPVFLAKAHKLKPMYPRLVQLRLKRYLAPAALDPHPTPPPPRRRY